MSNGRHSADDGSFQRSAGNAAVRGALLIAVAVVLGLLLLSATDDNDPFSGDTASRERAATTTTSTTTPGADDPAALPDPRPPAEVKVLVANGSGVNGAASRWSEQLQARGYNVLSATDTREPATAPAIFYAEGFQAEANVLAGELGLPSSAVQPVPTPSPVDDTREANLLVVLDESLANRPG